MSHETTLTITCYMRLNVRLGSTPTLTTLTTKDEVLIPIVATNGLSTDEQGYSPRTLTTCHVAHMLVLSSTSVTSFPATSPSEA